MIDTHAHLYDEQYEGIRSKVIDDAVQTGVCGIYLPNLSLATIAPMVALAKSYPDLCFPMLGLHPCEVRGDVAMQLAAMEAWWDRHDFVGVGEVGIDLYRNRSYREEQLYALHRAIDWALDRDLPLVLHARGGEALPLIIATLQERQKGALRGVVHCFSGSLEEAQQLIGLGFMLGIGGMVTYPQSAVAPFLDALPLASLLLETDAPYLTPIPHRGKINQPAYLIFIAQVIADHCGVPLNTMVDRTTANACAFFGQQQPIVTARRSSS